MSRWSAVAAALLVGACATASPTPEAAADDARPTHEGGMHERGMQHDRMQGEGMQGMRMGRQEATVLPETPDHLERGERIFEEICSQCHTLDPPPNLAPPMSHVARHLKQEFDDEAGAVAHVLTYLPAPSAERSILPEMARQRFGLMAPLALPEEQLRAVGRYIWWMANAIE